MAVASFKISDDLNLDGVTFNLAGATTGQVLSYASASTSFVPTTETPVGTIVMHAGSSVPPGWLLCDGSLYNISSYITLGNLLLSRFGGNGTTTFAVPNLVSRPVLGAGNANTSQSSLSLTSDFFNHSHTATYGTDGTSVSLAHTHSANLDTGHTHSVTSDDKGTHTHGGAVAAGGAHTHTYQTKLSGGTTNTGFSDTTHEHGSTANDANHSHNDASNSLNHTHTATGNADLSHSHSISSIANSSTQNTSISNHSHGTFAVMQVMFIIRS